jgi:hypothetical protein
MLEKNEQSDRALNTSEKPESCYWLGTAEGGPARVYPAIRDGWPSGVRKQSASHLPPTADNEGKSLLWRGQAGLVGGISRLQPARFGSYRKPIWGRGVLPYLPFA